MLNLKKKRMVSYLLWIFLYVLLMTIVISSIIYLLDGMGEIYYQAQFSSLCIGMLVFGIMAFMVLKRHVSYGKSRRTFFKESTGTILFFSIYSIIIIHLFAWILNMVLDKQTQIILEGGLFDYILYSLIGLLAAILFYYIGQIIYFAFNRHLLLGIFVCLLVSGLGIYFINLEYFIALTHMELSQPILLLTFQLIAVFLLGMLVRNLLINGAIRI